jgi:hypothetical protein
MKGWSRIAGRGEEAMEFWIFLGIFVAVFVVAIAAARRRQRLHGGSHWPAGEQVQADKRSREMWRARRPF